MKNNKYKSILILATIILPLSGCSKVNPNVMVGEDGHVHSFEYVEEIKPKNCGEVGYRAYYTCKDCNLLFDENYNIIKFTDLKYSVPHSLTFVEGIESTFSSEGEYNHYHCSSCNKDFMDKDGKEQLTSIVMPKKSHYLMDDLHIYRFDDKSLVSIIEDENSLTITDNECKANSFVYLPVKKGLDYVRVSVEVEWEVIESYGIVLENNTRHALCGLIPYDNVNFIRYSYGSTNDFNRSYYRGSFDELNEKGAGIETLPNGNHKCTLTVFRDEKGIRLYCGHYMAWSSTYEADPQSIGADDTITVGIMYRPNRYSYKYIKPLNTVSGVTTFESIYNNVDLSETFTFTGKYNEDKTSITDLSVASNGKKVAVNANGMFTYDDKPTGFYAYQFNEDGSCKKDVGYSCTFSNFNVEELIRKN